MKKKTQIMRLWLLDSIKILGFGARTVGEASGEKKGISGLIRNKMLEYATMPLIWSSMKKWSSLILKNAVPIEFDSFIWSKKIDYITGFQVFKFQNLGKMQTQK